MNSLVLSSLMTRSNSSKAEITMCDPKSLVEWKDFNKKRIGEDFTKEKEHKCVVEIPELQDASLKRQDIFLFCFYKNFDHEVGSGLDEACEKKKLKTYSFNVSVLDPPIQRLDLGKI